MAEPWASWLRLAAGLGLAPAAFWRLSLVEWRALAASAAPQALSRNEFEALRRRFPDGADHGP